MNRCAAGNELPNRDACPKCGASSNEPCPEALRMAREERDSLVAALEYALNELDYIAKKHGYVSTEAAAISVRQTLELVGSPKHD